MCVACFLMVFVTIITIVASLFVRYRAQRRPKVITRKAPYSCIHIKYEDIMTYSRLETACRLQMKGLIGTKRLIITDEQMKPTILMLRMSLNRDWYRFDVTPDMRYKAKIMDDDSDAEDSGMLFKLSRCRQTDVVDEILTMASDDKTRLWSLITQHKISPLGELFGNSVRLKRRRLMTIITEPDRI